MKVDYSYVDTFFKIIDENADISELESNVGFQTILSHALLTGNDFNLKSIDDAVKGMSDQAYGLRNLLKNVDRIKALYKMLRTHEKKWVEEVREYTGKLFNNINNEITMVFPVVGYDIGIGINNIVCVNLNSEICLKDYRELISVIIHETTHTYYETIHGPILDFFKIDTSKYMKNLLDNVIQYEGAGVFSAEEYRVKNNLPKTGSPIQEDYNISTNKTNRMNLFQEYKHLSISLISGELKEIEDFMRRGFGESKLAHRLGYSIFTEINKVKGIEGVREAIHMSNKDFIEKFLK